VLVAKYASRVAAMLSCLVFLLVFAFSRNIPNGNYNFIAPYSHEITHGLALSLGALWFIERFGRHHRAVDVACAGFFTGCVFLTKLEIFLALCPAISIAVALYCTQLTAHRSAAVWIYYVLAGAAAPVAAVLLLCCMLPPQQAILSATGGFRWLLDREIT